MANEIPSNFIFSHLRQKMNMIEYIKRSQYLRFIRNLTNTRKTALYIALKSKQKESDFYADCLPDEIIKYIVGFV